MICRIAVAYKRGLEAFHAQRVGELGCPILFTVHGQGVFEASNLVWIDEKSVILATGLRSNQEGYRQVRSFPDTFTAARTRSVRLPVFFTWIWPSVWPRTR